MPIHEGDYQDPEEKKIEDKRKMLKIPTPDDFKTQASRDALYRLNKRAADLASSKNDTAIDMAKKHEAERKAKPFVYKKGGRVQRGGLAKIHKGELVMTKRQASKLPRKPGIKAY